MEVSLDSNGTVATGDTDVAAELVLAELEISDEVKKIVRAMKSALSRTKKAVDMVGLAETKAIDTAFSGVDHGVVDMVLCTQGLAVKEQDGLRLIIRKNDDI